MSIEALVTSLIESLDRNTAAVLGAGGKTAAAETTTAAEKAAPAKAAPAKSAPAKTAPAKPKHSEDDVVAALTKIKDEFGPEGAKEVIKALGFAKMAEITADKYDEAVKLAEEKYAELEAGEGDGDGL